MQLIELKCLFSVGIKGLVQPKLKIIVTDYSPLNCTFCKTFVHLRNTNEDILNEI